MSMKMNHKLPAPEELKAQYPLSEKINLPEGRINSSFLWVPALRIMKNLSVSM